YSRYDKPDIPFSSLELRRAVKKTNFRSSPGPDGIKGHNIKMALTYSETPILNIFNKCLQLGYYPKAWKIGKILLFPKGSSPKSGPLSGDHFRPIALLPILSKIFERLILNRLQWR